MPHKNLADRRAWWAKHYANLSPEKKQKILEQGIRAKKKYRANLTPEKKATEADKGRARNRNYWESLKLDPEKKKRHNERNCATVKKWYAQLIPETKKARSKKQREKVTPEQKYKALKYVRDRYANDEEYRQRKSEQRTLAGRKYRSNWSPEMKKTISEKRQTDDKYQQQLLSAHLRVYGLTPDQFASMLASQKGTCAICGSIASPRKRLHVDHCHTTGKIRGLLCQNCNLGLGRFKDDPNLLRLAAAYLE